MNIYDQPFPILLIFYPLSYSLWLLHHCFNVSFLVVKVSITLVCYFVQILIPGTTADAQKQLYNLGRKKKNANCIFKFPTLSLQSRDSESAHIYLLFLERGDPGYITDDEAVIERSLILFPGWSRNKSQSQIFKSGPSWAGVRSSLTVKTHPWEATWTAQEGRKQ